MAAKVNSEEITIHQINRVLARSAGVAGDQAEPLKRQILERLIDQELAKQQAIESKLDRSPSTMQAIEAARGEILAAAYLQQIAAAQQAPSMEEVKKYYAEHPELFAQRRLFGIEEISFGSKEAAAMGLADIATKARDMREIAGALKARSVVFNENRGVRAAEQIPLEWLRRLQKMKEGEVQVFENGERSHVIRLAGIKQAPIDEATATPRIQQFLKNRSASGAIAREVKELRHRSNIEYLGEFAREAARREADVGKAASAPSSPDIEKGVRGLR